MELLKTYLDPAVFGTLTTMSVLMLAFTIERYIHYARIRLDSFEHILDLEVDLTNNLTLIASVGSNAPYIGLLGTVLGILITFYDLGQGGAMDARSIMLGLALALKATAGGLVVAIPSMLFYNALLRRVDVLKARWEVQQT